jgi:hypothetical protein
VTNLPNNQCIERPIEDLSNLRGDYHPAPRQPDHEIEIHRPAAQPVRELASGIFS